LQQIFTSNPLHPCGFAVIAPELPLGKTIHTLQLLLLPKLRPIIGKLSTPCLPMLPRRIGTSLVAALVGVATISLQEELSVFSTTQAANWT
jgi:hypothetical protein